MRSGHDKPSALQFKYRLRWYVLGKHSADMMTENCNTENDDVSLVDSVDFADHSSVANAVMEQILEPLNDSEMYDLIEKTSNVTNANEISFNENFDEGLLNSLNLLIY